MTQGCPKPLTRLVKFIASTFDESSMAPVRNRGSLSRLLLTSLLVSVSLPHSIAGATSSGATSSGANAAPIAPLSSSRLAQSAANEAIADDAAAATTAATTAPDLAPAIAQLKANNPAAAEALLLTLQARDADRLDVYQYLAFSRLLQAEANPSKYADLLIDLTDRAYQGHDYDLIEPPAELADRLVKPMQVFQDNPPPAMVAALAARVAAQPNAIAPRLAWVTQLSRPDQIARTSPQLQTQITDLRQRHGQNAPAMAFLASRLIDNHLLVDALPILEQVVKTAPDRIDLRQQLAQTLAGSGEFAEAQQILTAGLDPDRPLTPEGAELLLARAEIQQSIGDRLGALATHDWILSKAPDRASHDARLQVAQELGQLDSAIESYKALAPSNPAIAAQGYKAAALILRGANEPAPIAQGIAMIEAAHRLAPQDEPIAIQLIETYREHDRAADALKVARAYYKPAHKSSQGKAQGKALGLEITPLLIELLSSSGPSAEAQAIGNALIAQQPDAAPQVLNSLLAGLVAAQGQSPSPAQYRQTNAAAIALTRQFIRQYPKQTTDFYETLLPRLGGDDRIPQSLAIYQTLAQLDPKNSDYLLQQAWMLQGNKQFSEAIAVFQTMLRRDPKNGVAYVALGNLLVEGKRIPEALALYKTGISQVPDIASDSGVQLMQDKYYADAIGLYEFALKASPNNVNVLSDYGYALEKSGQADRATAAYRKALDLTPRPLRGTAQVAGRLVRHLARHGSFDRAIDEAIAIADRPQPGYGAGSNNPIDFLIYGGDDSDNRDAIALDRRLYDGLIAKLTPQGPSLTLAAAHAALGGLLLSRMDDESAGIRTLKTAQAMYRQLGRPDRVYALSREHEVLQR
jgi:Flp pilus assembly protein TadD